MYYTTIKIKLHLLFWDFFKFIYIFKILSDMFTPLLLTITIIWVKIIKQNINQR